MNANCNLPVERLRRFPAPDQCAYAAALIVADALRGRRVAKGFVEKRGAAG
jgi:hypothetical protein